MKRPTLTVFVLLATATLLWIGLQRGATGAHHDDRAASSARASAERDAGAPSSDDEPSGLEAALGAGGAGAAAESDSDAGGVLLDGGAVPKLVTGSPKAVRFGVVLVRYAGAEGAPPGTRSRAEAQGLAEQLAELAREDFDTAVDKGDPGSTKDAGRMFRGVLEPAPEYVLFSLDEDEVSEPVDTPRGFWIVKRID